jgi:hypothetical protein
VTDPHSRNLKTTRGWVQGYNAQLVVGAGQIVLAAGISTESLDTENLEPMIATACDELERAGVSETPGLVLGDAGYWKNNAIQATGAAVTHPTCPRPRAGAPDAPSGMIGNRRSDTRFVTADS